MSITTKEIITDNKVEEVEGQSICECCKDHEVTKVALIASSRWEMRNILPKWFKGLGAKEIISHEQSESEGNVTITIFYR